MQLLILAAERGRRLPPRGQPDSHGPQGYYFAACEEDPTYADLGRMVGEALGRRLVVVIPTATPLVWMVAGAGEAISRIRHDPLFMNLDKAREITAGSWLCSAVPPPMSWVSRSAPHCRNGFTKRPSGIGKRAGSERF